MRKPLGLRKIAVAGLAIGALAFAGCAETKNHHGGGGNQPAAVSDQDKAETMVDIVLDQNPDAARTVDQGVKMVGYDWALSEFEKGYGASQNGVSSEDAFNELLSR